MLGYWYRNRFGSKIAWANRMEGERVGVGPGTEQVVEGNDPHGGHGWVYEGEWLVLGWAMGWQRSNCCVIGSCLLSLRLCRRGFQDLLKVRPSSLLMSYGCTSSSIASLMSQSMYPVLAERCFVSCSLIMCSWFMLCSATADLLGCASLIFLLCSSIRSWMDRPLCPI